MEKKILKAICSAAVVLISATAAHADWKSDWAKAVAKGKKEGKVTLYGGYNPIYRKYSRTFEKKFPGITVDFVPGGGSQHAVRILAERRAKKFVADIVMGGATTFQNYPDGTFDPLLPHLILPEVKDKSAWLGGALPFIDPAAKYVLSTRGSVGRGIAYNTKMVNPKEIQAWKDLLNPKWDGKILRLSRRNAVSNTFIFFYHAKALGPKFIKALLKNNRVVETKNRRQATNWLAEGKALFLLDATPRGINKANKKGLPVAFVRHPLKEANLVAGGYCCMAVLDRAPHPNAAKVLINWMLSKEGQIAYQKVTKENSLRVDIPKDGLPKHIVPRAGGKYFHADLSRYSQPKDLKAIRKLIKDARKR
jgi:ABC-type Fe3+ transport system substrate-binding protein